jgi:hypothetical protein
MDVRKPLRVTRSYKQTLVGVPSRVLPLLCPVREADWIEGWDPVAVLSESGVAEEDCVFVTRSEPSDAVWYITRHEQASGVVEMVRITPGVTACRLTIQVRSAGEGSEAVVTYSHTSLGPLGDAFVSGFTEEYYETFMREWEARLNFYLANGRLLTGDGDR